MRVMARLAAATTKTSGVKTKTVMRTLTHVFHAGQPFFHKAEEISAGAACFSPVGDGDVAQLVEHEERDRHKQGERQAYAQRFVEKKDKDAGKQQAIAQHLQDKL
jgi:hypothetical protein